MHDTFLQEVVQINFLPVCIIIFMIIFLVFNNRYEHELTRLFNPVLLMLLGLMAVDNADYFAFTSGQNGLVHTFIQFLGYNLRIFILVKSILIALRNSQKKYLKIALYIPAGINLIITFMALFVDNIFRYNEEGELVRGPLGYTPHAMLILYAIFMYVYSVHIWIRHKRHCEATIISIMITLAVVGTFCEMIFGLWGILIGVIAMAITFYYLCIHIEFFKFDILTGALNRASFYADINAVKSKEKVGIISIDLNDLKIINDTKGHLEGDQAIKIMAHTIYAAIDSRSKLYRMGGDEFAVICRDMSDTDVKLLVDRIRIRMNESNYKFAIGYSMWDGREELLEVFARADIAMYNNKKELKGSENDQYHSSAL